MGIFDDNFRSNLADSLNYDLVPVNTPSRPEPSGETWQQAGMTQYKGYYYQIADANALLDIDNSNWTYSLYPPSAASTAFFNYSQLMRLQDGFSSFSSANNAVRQYIDGLESGTADADDTGSADIIDIGLDDIPFIVPDDSEEEEKEDIPDTSTDTTDTDTQSVGLTDDQRFMLIGLVVLGGILGFIKK